MFDWCSITALDTTGLADAINALNEKDLWDILQALSPIIIGAIAICLAFLQWRTTEKQRKQSLFDVRFRAYEKILFICNALLQRGGTKGLPESTKNLIEENFYFLNHQFKLIFSVKSQEWLNILYQDFYLIFEERAALDERVPSDKWNAFKIHINDKLKIVQNEIRAY